MTGEASIISLELYCYPKTNNKKTTKTNVKEPK